MGCFARLQQQSNDIGIQFLLTELDAAFTFLDVAGATASVESRERNHEHASEAYETVRRMQQKVVMHPDQQESFQTRLADLRSRLQDLGRNPA